MRLPPAAPGVAEPLAAGAMVERHVRGALIRQEKAVAGNQRHEPNHERTNTRLGCHRCKGNGDKRCGGLPAKH